jgi:thymidine kinase
MFAGKTTHLLEKVRNYITFNEVRKIDVKILIINSIFDKRESMVQVGKLSTHNNYNNYDFPSYVSFIKTERLCDIPIGSFDYIGIDESQFYPDLVVFVKMALEDGKNIHCVGLLADYMKRPFGQLFHLIPLADEMNQLKAYCVGCECREKNAIFTKKIVGGGDVIDIGGKDKYTPVCGKHY